MRHSALLGQTPGRRLLLVLALCALLLRGLIPAGYMPASSPDYASALTFCVQGSPELARWGGHAPEPDPDSHLVHPACLFGQVQAQGALPLATLPAWITMVLPAHTWNAPAPADAPVLALPGPAVGARAPPSRLPS